MIEQIQGEVNEMCQNFSTNTGIEVSSNARNLIAMVLSSIIEDPHQSWKTEHDKLEFFVRSYIDAISMLLYQIVQAENISNQITFFDVFHWLSRNFTICIIGKD
jgi:hypothetical protein